MSPSLHLAALILMAYVSVFASSQFMLFRAFAGVQIDPLPSLMVYCGLRAGLGNTSAVAIVGGLLADSVSGNPLGVSVFGLFLAGFIAHQKRDLVLRQEPYAQFVLGCFASAAVPAASLALLLLNGHRPLAGWGTFWQWGVAAASGGLCAPIIFWIFDRLNASIAYQVRPEMAYRGDREIKRGRH